MLPLILAALRAVAPHLATDGGGMDVVLPSNGFLAFAFLNSQIDCVSLLAGQLFIHCNTKVIVPGDFGPLFPDFVNVSPKNHLQIMGRYVDVVS